MYKTYVKNEKNIIKYYNNSVVICISQKLMWCNIIAIVVLKNVLL